MRLVSLALVLLPFFVSMVVTNDVALITFVPFAVLVLGLIGRTEYLAPLWCSRPWPPTLGAWLPRWVIRRISIFMPTTN